MKFNLIAPKKYQQIPKISKYAQKSNSVLLSTILNELNLKGE